MTTPLTFFHISDTHLGPTPTYVHRGYNPYDRAQRLITEIKRLGVAPDFIIHTGDVCGDKDTHATSAHYELARDLFTTLPSPFYYVVGNHDDANTLFSTLPMGPHDVFFEHNGDRAYTFTAKGVTCIALQSSIPTLREGLLPPDQLHALQGILGRLATPAFIFLHHPPLPIGSPWMDQYMLISNGAALHELLKPFREKIQGVFFGHIHQALDMYRDGIRYISSPASIFQFSTLPSDTTSALEPESTSGYALVSYSGGDLRINPRIVPGTQAGPMTN